MNRISLCLSLLIFVIVSAGSVYAENKAVSGNNMIVVNQDSQGTMKSVPDVCKTPSPDVPGAIPIPYPNTATSSDTTKGSKKVKADGNPVNIKGSYFKTSDGDEPGSK